MWQRLSAKAGTKGERWYDWQYPGAGRASGRYLLFWRSRPCRTPQPSRPMWCMYPRPVPPPPWCIEQAFAVAKSEVGLDEYEVYTAHGWARRVTLSLWGLALLNMVWAHAAAPPPTKSSHAGAGPRPDCGFEPDRDLPSVVAPGAPDSGRGGTRGHSGTASTNGWPCSVTGNAVRRNCSIYNCRIKYLAPRRRKAFRGMLIDAPSKSI